MLERYGHTPRDLHTALLQLVCQHQSPWALPDLCALDCTEAVQPRSEHVQQIVEALFSLLTEKEKKRLAHETMVSYHSAKYTVPTAMLEETLQRQITSQPPLATVKATAGGGAACRTAKPSLQPAINLIHTAIDAGWLVCLGEEVGLDSLRVLQHFTGGGVHA